MRDERNERWEMKERKAMEDERDERRKRWEMRDERDER